MSLTFKQKVAELLELPQDVIEAEAFAVLETFSDWPVSTEVRLSRVAFLLAGLLREPDPNVRKVRVSEALVMKDYAG